MQIFDLTPSHPLGHAVAKAAGYPVALHEARLFSGGQQKLRPLVSVRGQDVFVFAALHATQEQSVNDGLIQLLFFCAACQDHGAARVTAVVPWLPYSRKDRVTKPRDPVNTRTVARLIEAAGVQSIVTVDVHNPAAFQNAFRCPTLNIDTCRLFATEIVARRGNLPLTIMSPDGGGINRAEALRQAVEVLTNRPVGFAFAEKHRSGDKVSGSLFAGDVAGQEVWIVDDMIETGGTALRAARACQQRGAAAVHLLATHLLPDPAETDRLIDPSVESVTVTDSALILNDTGTSPQFHTLSLAPTIGQCLMRMHQGHPVSPVMDPTGLSR
jgi:ribose-phosphate pyrophosphokinase